MVLGAFAAVLGDLLGRVNREALREQQLIYQAAELALGETAHNITSQLSGFATFIAQYRLYQRQLPQLREINDKLADFHAHVLNSLRRIKDRVGFVRLRPQQNADLTPVIARALSTVVYEENDIWRWDGLAPKAILGEWDLYHWNNVFTELAQNSRDFARPGTDLIVVVSVELSEVDGKNWVAIHYRDNGRGVSRNLKKRIFDGRSFRNKGDRPGYGMGLSYVRKVIAASGGTIEECGRLGTGVHFVITVPTQPPPPSIPLTPEQ
ncbi:MAG: HAMP domain-containing sensor histidine kinase, partial [Verrucomicrobia bacterium]|nr:HAMP domain-containing sensor histidine kinase [Verrucomicrobiota bacterium]